MGFFFHDSLHLSITLGPTEGRGRVYIIVIFLVVPHTLTTARGLYIGFSLIHQPLISHLSAEAHHLQTFFLDQFVHRTRFIDA